MGVLSYAVSGDRDRPTILFLHGFLGSAGDWWEVMAAMADEFHCVAVDLPGHGSSVGLPEETYAFEGAARAIISTLDELQVGQATFVGYSMGGRLALYMALRYPQRCHGLFLESASPGLESAEEREARRVADEEQARRLETNDFEGFLRDWYRQPLFATLARDEELLERTIEARRRNDPAELARLLRGMGTGSQPSLWKELTGLRVSALAMGGELDQKFVDLSRRMAASTDRLQTVVVSGVGHNVRVEAPMEYVAVLKDFTEGI